ncbi:uncharacterized protein SRS1_11576 [Sporisorium reilianum f. sp. reilianum]|uniref:Transcriptional regulator n=1 Tax=Sporisorium reilianum f. sp. reilianum TaxID=72559 RepID=A0A2N8U6F8_9BASI|nr:uncharacterized protein SRS1_11576 [Sporisorium reilianum f. sp. reilianum]
MYLRAPTAVCEWSAVEAFLAAHSLGLLTTAIPLAGQSTIQASHLPFLFHAPNTPPPPDETPSTSGDGTWHVGPDSSVDLGRLQCHLARANPQAKALLSLTRPEEVLVVFASPLNQAGYITPQWYTTTKPLTAKTVPTWNYAELHIYGLISPTTPETLRQIVSDLSDVHEHKHVEKKGEGDVWKVEDAPEAYIRVLERSIVGMEIKIMKVGLKMKMSREKGEGDRQGVLEGLRGLGGDAGEMADLVERLGPIKKAS